MTFSPQTSKTYGKYSWKAARNINIVCFCFNLNICSEPHKHTVEKASVPKLWVLLISRVTHVNEIFNEVFLCLEQNLEVLVSLCLSMDRQTNISIHRAATYYLQLLQFGHCKGEEGKRLNSLISTAFEADCCLLSQCAAEVTVWWRHQNHIIHNKQKEKKKNKQSGGQFYQTLCSLRLHLEIPSMKITNRISDKADDSVQILIRPWS